MWSRATDGTAREGLDPLQYRYRVLRRLLAANSEILEVMAELEADLGYLDPSHPNVQESVLRLLDGSLLLAEELNLLTGDANAPLYEVHRDLERAIRAFLTTVATPDTRPLVLPLQAATAERVGEVGGKAANLGQVRAAMPEAVPPGFVVTTAAYRLFLEENRLFEPIRTLLRDLSLITERDLFRERTAAIRALLSASAVPDRVRAAIEEGRAQLAPLVPRRWAVRSSAVGEDGRMSFAGQFDSLLGVPPERLSEAYRDVLISRWSDRAILYRLASGFSEVDTPMAVLFLPMLEARAAGVLYTRDPRDAERDVMVIEAVRGLADDMVRGRQAGVTVVTARQAPHAVIPPIEGEGPAASGDDPLSAAEASGLAAVGLEVERYFGRPQDIEWVLTEDRRLMVVQSRPLLVQDREAHGGQSVDAREPVLSGGVTVAPGRAAGPVRVVRDGEEAAALVEGSILVVRQATPELAGALFAAGGVIAEAGNPAGHAAALIREFGLPALFGVPGAIDRLSGSETVSLDATRRRVYSGVVWPDVVEQTRARASRTRLRPAATPLHDAILTLNLTDPFSSQFRPRGCRSLHDIVRYAHEKAVAAMFELGDAAGRAGGRRVWRLTSATHLNLAVLDLGGAIGAEALRRKDIAPEQIRSAPFQALWRGMTAPGVSWAGRSQISVAGFASVIGATMTGAQSSLRELGGRNYVIVGPDYLNLNARLAYHFAMVDALVTDSAENNFVNFRFRGGAADSRRRDMRARFLAEALMAMNFGVDRRGDLVTAWLRRYPAALSESGLESLGALMACARQLDMLMTDEEAVRHFVARFLARDFGAFA